MLAIYEYKSDIDADSLLILNNIYAYLWSELFTLFVFVSNTFFQCLNFSMFQFSDLFHNLLRRDVNARLLLQSLQVRIQPMVHHVNIVEVVDVHEAVGTVRLIIDEERIFASSTRPLVGCHADVQVERTLVPVNTQSDELVDGLLQADVDVIEGRLEHTAQELRHFADRQPFPQFLCNIRILFQ